MACAFMRIDLSFAADHYFNFHYGIKTFPRVSLPYMYYWAHENTFLVCFTATYFFINLEVITTYYYTVRLAAVAFAL